MTNQFRIEKDSMGEVKVPAGALFGAQTQRAIENFPISNLTMPVSFIKALALVKGCCAKANLALHLLPSDIANAIYDSSHKVANGQHLHEFPIDVFQTGSGTSTNMNMNEVLATLASQKLNAKIHPNDHVNKSQSSNDVIPTTMHVSAAIEVKTHLLPAINHLIKSITKRANKLKNVVKTGRTHLMDAMPLTMQQELSGWSKQLEYGHNRISETLERIYCLAIGGTAVGTGINTHPIFGEKVCHYLNKETNLYFVPSDNYFYSLSCQDSICELSGQLRVLAVSLMKIANDLRWMNSGPLTGLAEISLPPIQPGSSIMPGKVNPVIPEAVAMVCAQVMGNDTTISIAAQSGNFQLNVMVPLIAYNILHSIQLLSNSCMALANKAINGFTVNVKHIQQQLNKNPILVTALNPIIGYEQGAAIAKRAYSENLPVLDVAKEMTSLSEAELRKYLDPVLLTHPTLDDLQK